MCVHLQMSEHFIDCAGMCSYLTKRLIKLLQDALLIKHLALVSVFVVVMDFLSEVRRQFVERHVLLHLFVLQDRERCVRQGHAGINQLFC